MILMEAIDSSLTPGSRCPLLHSSKHFPTIKSNLFYENIYGRKTKWEFSRFFVGSNINISILWEKVASTSWPGPVLSLSLFLRWKMRWDPRIAGFRTPDSAWWNAGNGVLFPLFSFFHLDFLTPSLSKKAGWRLAVIWSLVEVITG